MSLPSKKELLDFFQSDVFNSGRDGNYDAAIEEFYNRFGPCPIPLIEIVKNKKHITELFEFITGTPYGGHFVRDDSIVFSSVLTGLFNKFQIILKFDGSFELLPASARISLSDPEAVKDKIRFLGYN